MSLQQGSASLAGGASAVGAVNAIEAAAAALATGVQLNASDPNVPFTFSFLAGDANGVSQAQWSSMTLGAQGAFFGTSRAVNVAIQVEGIFGSSGKVNIEGTNDNTHVEVLKDPSGSALSITAAGIYAVGTIPAQLRPNIVAGDGTTSLEVTIIQRPEF